MMSPWVMLLLLVYVSMVLAVVLSCYRDDDPRRIVRGSLRRAGLFCAAVICFAAVAYAVSATILSPVP